MSKQQRSERIEWEKIVEEMKRQELSVAEAAKRFGVNRKSLYAWKKKAGIKEEVPPVKFQEVELPQSHAPKETREIEIVVDGSIRLLCRGMSLEEVGRLVGALREGVH